MSTQSGPGGLEGSDGHDLIFGDNPQSLLAIPKTLLAKLSAHVNEGVQRLSPGGLEVGGLLVGPNVPGGRVVVDGIIPLPIEYRFGPLFQMSVFDLPRIAAAIESVQGDKTVVGFYRSRSRDFRTLRESDHEIFAAIEAAHKSFATVFRCFFILAPTSESTALACIAIRNGNSWHEMQPYTLGLNPPAIIAFPTSTALQELTRNLQPEEPPNHLPVSAPVQPAVDAGIAQNIAPETAKHIAEPAPPNRGGIRRARVWMYAVSGVLALWIASVFLSGSKEQARPFPNLPENTAPRLGFSATFESPVWRLSWNRTAMDELKPVGAVLSIQDGAIQQQVPLAPADLSSGTIFYTPQSGDLNFGLRVDRGGSFAEEHVRVLAAPGTAPKPAEHAGQVVPTKTAAQTGVESQVVPPAPNKQVPAAGASSKTVAAVAPATPAKPDPSTQETAQVSPDQEVKSLPAPVFQPTVMALATPVPPVMEPPRVVAPPAAPTAKSAPQPVKEPVKQTATPAVTPPVITPSAASPAKSEPAAPAASLVPPTAPPNPAAAAPAPAKANYVGPRPIQQVSPQMPGNTSPDVTQVQVLVEIDVRGKVTKTTPIAWNARNASMMAVAVRAASSWLFEPAQLNGHAVPSQMTLTFRINPPPAR